jgi:hypothetical protein
MRNNKFSYSNINLIELKDYTTIIFKKIEFW